MWFRAGLVFTFFQLILVLTYFLDLSLFPIFSIGVFCIYLSARPVYILSPRNVLFGYYLLWYVVAPAFASRYQGLDFALREYSISFLMLFATYGVAYTTLAICEKFDSRTADQLHVGSVQRNAAVKLAALLILSFIFCSLIVLKTGGLSNWIADPGKAFLTREGAGHFSILFMFTLATAVGVGGSIAHVRRSRALIVFLVIVCLALSPVIGSKMQLLLLLTLLLAPVLVRLKTASFGLVAVASMFVFAFVLGLYFRNITWIEPADLLSYSLNYFSTLEMLVISVSDFEPSFGKTFFLPFNKFLTPFGIVDDIHYDMSGWLTSIYFPESWEIRATEQWPVETDLYLSFYYVLGLPLIAIYFAVCGALYKRAIISSSHAYLFCSVSFTFGMVTHLRGGVINWTDFYFYPSLIASYFILKGVVRRKDAEGSNFR